MPRRNPAGSRRWNAILERIIERCVENFELVESALLADGAPPFHEPIDDERRLYDQLIALRAANSPVYWNDPTAQAKLQKLVLRFGPPPTQPGAAPFAVPGAAPTVSPPGAA